MRVKTKICGVKSPEALDAAIQGGVAAIGFVFFPPSPRSITTDTAEQLISRIPRGILRVALTVDMDDAELLALSDRLPLDLLQLHGNETPERVLEIKKLTGLPIMKAIKVAEPNDILEADLYSPVAERILFDAKPPKMMKGALPGGNALSFNWKWLAGKTLPYPWVLSGGLNSENIQRAIEISGASFIDVSSGVESTPGVKDPERIRYFLNIVKDSSPCSC
ncbi:MAG: phosphoribosylanthranilate isomerase [Rhodospirillaceae bacterium]